MNNEIKLNKSEIINHCFVLNEIQKEINKGNLTDEIINIINSNPEYLEFIFNMNEDQKFILLDLNPYLIKFMKNPTNKMKLYCVKKDWRTLQIIDEQNSEICEEALSQSHNAIIHIKPCFLTYDIHVECLKKNGLLLYYFGGTTPEMCRIAVKQNCNAIKYCFYQDEEIALDAVSCDGMLLYHVINQTEKIQLCAIKNNYKSIQFIDNPSDSIIEESLKINKNSINFIKKNTKKKTKKKLISKIFNCLYEKLFIQYFK